ncbi:MAG: MBL fold metallo-hydrolase [Aridibacter famidurans]|nr:MBL fold metallo-hydrolase [Aridibacter famidurans]
MKAILLITALAAGLLTACSLSPGTVAQADTTSEPARDGRAKVTYIANEGVMIEAGEDKILIDGLHRKYLDEYAYPPDDLREKIENAEGEFRGIDFVLVSHVHGDHFHPESVGRLLMKSGRTTLASSPQVAQLIKEKFSDHQKVKRNVHAVDFEFGKEAVISMQPADFVPEREAKAKPGIIVIRFLGLSHGTGRHATIQNLGHVIEIGGLKFLHLGDAVMSDENFDVFDLEKAGIDVAFIPYWYLLSERGRELVDRQFAPKHIIAVHVDVNEADKIKKDLEAADPRVRVFTKILETATF